jgi:hypothetical protein
MDVDTDGKLGCVHVIEHVAGTDKQGKKKELNLSVTEIYRSRKSDPARGLYSHCSCTECIRLNIGLIPSQAKVDKRPDRRSRWTAMSCVGQ